MAELSPLRRRMTEDMSIRDGTVRLTGLGRIDGYGGS